MSTWGDGPVQVRLGVGQTTITQDGIMSFSHHSGCCDNDIGFGAVCSASITATLFGRIDLYGETVTAELGAEDGGNMVWRPLGTFVVSECQTNDDSTSIKAQDAAWYATAGQYTPSASGMVSDVLADVASQCGLNVEQTTLNVGMSIPVSGALSGYTCREMLGFLAALCARNCVISRDGKIRFVWFTASGGSIDANRTYANARSESGTSAILGLKCTVGDVTLTVGNSEKAIEVKCPLMTQNRLAAIWNDFGGYTYPLVDLSCYGRAEIQPGDLVTVEDVNQSSCQMPVMSVELAIDGGCRCTLRSFGSVSEVRGLSGPGPREALLLRTETVAARALLSANGKNKCFYQASAPTVSAGLTEGDLWFDTANGNRLSSWTGTAWSAFTLRNEAVSNLDVGAITSGKLLARYIDVENLFAQDITATGSITGARLTTGQNFNVDRSGILTARSSILQLAQLITALMSNASIEDVLRFKCWDVNPAYPEPEEPEEAEDVGTAEAEVGATQFKEYAVYTEHEVLIIAKQDDEDTITPAEEDEGEDEEVTPPEPTEIARFYTDASNEGVVDIHHLNASGNLGVSGNLSAGSASVSGSLAAASASIGGGNAVKGVWTGGKVVNPGGNKWVTLFTASEAATQFGYTPNGTNTLVLASNGALDTSFSYLGICGGIQSDGTIVAELNRTINGLIRVNYMIVKIS